MFPQLKPNFMGTEYILKRTQPSSSSSSEDLCINFKPTGMLPGPRTMIAVLPLPEIQDSCQRMSKAGVSCSNSFTEDFPKSLCHVIDMAKNRQVPPYIIRKVAVICTKPAEFNEDLQCECTSRTEEVARSPQ
jgi:hypothetical protein